MELEGEGWLYLVIMITTVAAVILANVSAAVGQWTVRGWSSGRADSSPDNCRAPASFVREHAADLVKLDEEVEG